MRIVRLALIALPLALAGCRVPGLVAHGIKSYENSRSAPPAQPVEASAPAPTQSTAAPQSAARPEPPPPATVGPMPERTAVTVEPLK